MRDCDGDGDEKMEDANPSSEGPRPHHQQHLQPLDENNNSNDNNNPHMHISSSSSSSSSSSIIDPPFPLPRATMLVNSFFGAPNYLREHIRRHEQERQDEKRQKLEHQQLGQGYNQPNLTQEHQQRPFEKEPAMQHPPALPRQLIEEQDDDQHHLKERCGIEPNSHDSDNNSGENGLVQDIHYSSQPSVVSASSSTLPTSGYLPPYLRYPTVELKKPEQQEHDQPGSSSLISAQTTLPSVLTPSTTATTCGTPPTTGDDFPLPLPERPLNRGRDSKEDDGAPQFEPIVRRDATTGVRWVQTPHTCAYVKSHLPDNSDWQTRLVGRLESERQKKAKTTLRRHVTDPTMGYKPPAASSHFLSRHVSSGSSLSWSGGTPMDEDEGPIKRTRETAMRRREIRLMHTEGDRIGFAFQLLGRSIMFVRYKTNMYAVGTVCPHMQGDLSRGEVVPDIEDVSGSCGGETERKPKIILVCPHHNWKFCLSTGQNVGDEKSADKSIPRYVIKVDEVNGEKYFFISGGDIDFLLDQRESKQPDEPSMPVEPSSWKQRRMLVRRQTHV